MKEGKWIGKYVGAILSLFFIALVSFLLLTMILSPLTAIRSEHILIEDMTSIEVIDENYIIINTNDTNYTVKLYDDVDFTVSSEIYIVLEHDFERVFWWEEHQPEEYYTIERIIKVPSED